MHSHPPNRLVFVQATDALLSVPGLADVVASGLSRLLSGPTFARAPPGPTTWHVLCNVGVLAAQPAHCGTMLLDALAALLPAVATSYTLGPGAAATGVAVAHPPEDGGAGREGGGGGGAAALHRSPTKVCACLYAVRTGPLIHFRSHAEVLATR